MKSTNTLAWKNRYTPAVPTEARTRISLGKETFLTIPARSTMTPVEVCRLVEKKFHITIPLKR